MDHTYNVTEAFRGLVDTLESAEVLAGYVDEVLPFYAFDRVNPQPGRASLLCFVESSVGDINIYTPQQHQTAETVFAVFIDFVPRADEDLFLSDEVTTCLDVEGRVIQALMSAPYLKAAGKALTWTIQSIDRDTAIPDGQGGVDVASPVRRTEVRISVKSPLWSNS